MPRPLLGKISLFGNFGSLNIGNECTLQAIIFNVRLLAPSAEIQCICSDPADVFARHNISAVPMSRRLAAGKERSPVVPKSGVRRVLRLLFARIPYELGEWIRATRSLKGTDVLVMTGTGMLTDCGEGPFGLPYEIFKWAVSAKCCRVRLFFVSVGVEPMRSRWTKLFIKTSLRLADYVCFRDRHSRDAIGGIGFRGESSIFPDLAFSLPEVVVTRRERTASSQLVVGIGLYDYRGRGTGNARDAVCYSDYIAKLATFIGWLVERSYRVRILIGDIRYDNPVRGDLRKSLKRLGIEYSERNIDDDPVSSVSDVIDQIAATDVVIASRYHNVVLAIMLLRPVISISYEEKNDALMHDLGLGAYCQCLDDLDIGRLTEQFTQLEKERGRLKAEIEGRMKTYRAALTAQYSIVFGRSRVQLPEVPTAHDT